MRDRPLVEAVILVGLFGVLAGPMFLLTKERTKSEQREQNEEKNLPTKTAKRSGYLRLEFSEAYEEGVIEQNDKTILQIKKGTTLLLDDSEIELEWLNDTVELVVKTRRQDGKNLPFGVNIVLELDGLEERKRVLWSRTGTISEVVNFSW